MNELPITAGQNSDKESFAMNGQLLHEANFGLWV